jgi:hypothetical protein
MTSSPIAGTRKRDRAPDAAPLRRRNRKGVGPYAVPITELEPDDGASADRPTRRLGPFRRSTTFLVLGALIVVGLGVGVAFAVSGGGFSAPSSEPEGVPIEHVPDLASADTTASGAPVDGITCRTSMEQGVKYHVHQHMAVFVNGRQVRIPAGAGIAAPRLEEHLASGLFVDNAFNGCLYFLHVHVNDGIIHVESPLKRTFTLGQFFDIWQQPLGPDQVGPAKGVVVAFENGKRFPGSPRDIPLLAHAVIQLDVGTPVVPFQPVQFSVIGLCGAGTRGCSATSG